MRKRFAVMLATALLATVFSTLAPSPSQASIAETNPASLGMRPSGGFLNADRLAQYENELDSSINWYVGMAGRQSVADMKGSVYGQLRNKNAVLPGLADRMNLVMTVPLAFGKQTAKTEAGRADIRGRLIETANGAWDADFTSVAQTLVDGGYPDAVIRLGHEFTGGWYPWSAQGNEDAYIAAYRHVHQVMRAVSPDFRFEWNAARNTFVEYGPPAYPGDAFVDVVGLDVYYEPWKGDKAFDESYWQRRYYSVLVAHQEFAKAHGKPVSYAEWGNGGVDQPEFIEAMHGWFASLPTEGAGSLLYHAYFNVSKSLYNLDNYPKSKAKYIELFGGAGNAGAPSPADSLNPGDPASPDPIVVDVGTPAPAPTPEPDPAPAPQPDPVTPEPVVAAQGATQFSLFNQSVTHRADSYATMDFTELADWSSPVDYTNGKTYARFEITSKPSDKGVQVLTCMWRDRYTQETCISLGKYTEPGEHYLELRSVDRWWRKGAWDWDRPVDFVRLLVKDLETGKLLNSRACGSVCYTGNDLADHTPIGFDAQMILVANGETLNVPADWDGCPAEWGPGCADGETPPTTTPPTTTPPTTEPVDPSPTTTPPTTEPSAPSTVVPVDLPDLVVPETVNAVVGEQITIDIDSDAESFSWWRVRGPGGLIWVDRSVEDVQVKFLKAGTYELAVTARTDGRASRARTSVVVTDEPADTPTTTVPPATTPPTTSPDTTVAPTPPPAGGDDLPTLTVRAATAKEGSALVFKLVLDRAADHEIRATVRTLEVTATEGADYTARDVEVIIPAGTTKAYIGVPTKKDNLNEGKETLRLNVRELTGAVMDANGALGSIVNN